jgi:uncharacterized membrane protein (DUF485 family)
MSATTTAQLPPQAAYAAGSPAASQQGAWSEALAARDFRDLMDMKVRCVAPLLGGSLGLLVGIALLAGYAKPFMAQKVIGSLNLGYLLVLLAYITCWTVAVLYVRTANRRFDAQALAAVRSIQPGSAP